MLKRAMLFTLLRVALLGAQDAPLAAVPRRDRGLDLRLGYTTTLDGTDRAGTQTSGISTLPTFNAEARLLASHGLSLHLDGELFPGRPEHYSAAEDCPIICKGLVTSTSALQGGLSVRATRGPAYASVSLAERGTFTVACTVIVCGAWPADLHAAFSAVRRVGVGMRPSGSGIRPTVEANVSFYHSRAGVSRRDLELGVGLAY